MRFISIMYSANRTCTELPRPCGSPVGVPHANFRNHQLARPLSERSRSLSLRPLRSHVRIETDEKILQPTCRDGGSPFFNHDTRGKQRLRIQRNIAENSVVRVELGIDKNTSSDRLEESNLHAVPVRKTSRLCRESILVLRLEWFQGSPRTIPNHHKSIRCTPHLVLGQGFNLTLKFLLRSAFDAPS